MPLTIVPMTKKREFGSWNQESGIHGVESRDCLGFLYMGRFSGISVWRHAGFKRQSQSGYPSEISPANRHVVPVGF